MVNWFSPTVPWYLNGETIVFSTNNAKTTGYPWKNEVGPLYHAIHKVNV